MRMSDLIEACEEDFEDYLEEQVLSEASLYLHNGKRISKADGQALERKRLAQKKAAGEAQGKIYAALAKADKDPNSKCPDGFRRNAKGKCQSIHSLERESSEQSAKAIKQYKAMPMGGGAKKPSLVDRMKSMFGKK